MGGFRYIQGVTIAKDEAEAEAKLRDQLRLGSLPCELKEVELPDHVIVEIDVWRAQGATEPDITEMLEPVFKKQYAEEVAEKLKKPKK